MYFSQNKLGQTGGPQYWLNDLAPGHQEHLRRKKACPVILMTRYGEVSARFEAVYRDYKRDKNSGEIVAANAQHDRLQKGSSKHSIWGEICEWFGFPDQKAIERVDADLTLDGHGRFVLIPYKFSFRASNRAIEFKKPNSPLSVGLGGVSVLWHEQLRMARTSDAQLFCWAHEEINRVVLDHQRRSGISESDLLRAAGALRHLGVGLGPSLTKGFDCPESEFKFLSLPKYPCPVEIKHRASSLDYQFKRYAPLGRLAVLCMEDDLPNPPENVDVISLVALGAALKELR
ncbi:MAG: hypothetical protein HY302_02895 [Opitutae bacterium]|nr:hypothetical protein [Opitutae bacterium]